MHIPPIVCLAVMALFPCTSSFLVKKTKVLLPVKFSYPGQKGEDLPVLVSHVYPGQGCHPLRDMEGTHSFQQSSKLIFCYGP